MFTLCCNAQNKIIRRVLLCTLRMRELCRGCGKFTITLTKGYELVKLFEVWLFDEKSDSIFMGYIHTFLKGKQEASGYLPWALHQESRQKYIDEHYMARCF